VEQFEIPISEIKNAMVIIDLVAEKTNVFPSKGEAKKMIQGGGVSINKSKIENTELKISTEHLINNKYILVQKGKKNYYVVKAI